MSAKVDVILGLQWGDEGKGKIVDYLAPQYDIVARFQGGPNAGHTLVFGGKKYVLHTVPSGIFRPELGNVIGNGVVIDPVTLAQELQALDAAGVEWRRRLFVARKAHLILPTHRYLDAASEAAKGKEKIGSTLRGIGPTYMDKTGRNGLRVGDLIHAHFRDKYEQLKAKHLQLLKLYPPVAYDLEAEERRWFESLKWLRTLQIVDSAYLINEALDKGQRVLAEGAQGAMLDIDFGTYPFVTSSNTVSASVCIGLGVSPARIGEVFGIAKAYTTRVGSGPFPTELTDEVGARLQQEGHEFGATTGRPRRCGWLDLVQLRYTAMLNGVTQLVLTKIDVLNSFETIRAATHYRIEGQLTQKVPYDLMDISIEPVWKEFLGWRSSIADVQHYEAFPKELKHYIRAIEEALRVPVTMISTGPERQRLVLAETHSTSSL